jgi:hypothetical protein
MAAPETAGPAGSVTGHGRQPERDGRDRGPGNALILVARPEIE